MQYLQDQRVYLLKQRKNTDMKNPITLTNLKAAAITFIFAAVIAAVAPSISIQVESNAASACPADDPSCEG